MCPAAAASPGVPTAPPLPPGPPRTPGHRASGPGGDTGPGLGASPPGLGPVSRVVWGGRWAGPPSNPGRPFSTYPHRVVTTRDREIMQHRGAYPRIPPGPRASGLPGVRDGCLPLLLHCFSLCRPSPPSPSPPPPPPLPYLLPHPSFFPLYLLFTAVSFLPNPRPPPSLPPLPPFLPPVLPTPSLALLLQSQHPTPTLLLSHPHPPHIHTQVVAVALPLLRPPSPPRPPDQVENGK